MAGPRRHGRWARPRVPFRAGRPKTCVARSLRAVAKSEKEVRGRGMRRLGRAPRLEGGGSLPADRDHSPLADPASHPPAAPPACPSSRRRRPRVGCRGAGQRARSRRGTPSGKFRPRAADGRNGLDPRRGDRADGAESGARLDHAERATGSAHDSTCGAEGRTSRFVRAEAAARPGAAAGRPGPVCGAGTGLVGPRVIPTCSRVRAEPEAGCESDAQTAAAAASEAEGCTTQTEAGARGEAAGRPAANTRSPNRRSDHRSGAPLPDGSRTSSGATKQ